MKLIMGFVIGLFVCFSYSAFAAKPCQPVEDACKKAGYYVGGKKSGKGLYQNCLQPIVEGKTIPNVTVGEVDLKKCQIAAMEKMKQQKAAQTN